MSTLTTCDHCNEPFTASRSDARFCKPAHRVAAHRDTRRARIVVLLREHSATVRRGMAAGSMDTVRDDLDRIAAAMNALVA